MTEVIQWLVFVVKHFGVVVLQAVCVVVTAVVVLLAVVVLMLVGAEVLERLI